MRAPHPTLTTQQDKPQYTKKGGGNPSDSRQPTSVRVSSKQRGFAPPSADGSKVAFTQWSTSANAYRLFVVSSSGGTATEIATPGVDTDDPTFTPDGSKIVFEGNSNWIQIMNAADGSSLTQLPWGSEPSVSPDGTKIVLARGNDIWSMDITGGNETQLTNTGNNHDPMFVGNKIIFLSSRNDNRYEIYSMNYDGSGVIRLTNDTDPKMFDWNHV